MDLYELKHILNKKADQSDLDVLNDLKSNKIDTE
jgi:hypothetical protein